MSHIREDKSEVVHYDDPGFQVFYRHNYIPAGVVLVDAVSHWHDEVEFLYVLKGNIKYQLNGKTVDMAPGEGIFVNSRQMHVIQLEGNEVELYCVIFHPILISASPEIEKKFVKPIIENDSIPYIMLDENVEWNKKIFDALVEMEKYEYSHDYEYQAEGKTASHEIDTLRLLFDMWKNLYENISVEQRTKIYENQDLTLVKNMVTFIQDNYQKKITLQDICNAGNLGKTKCTAIFDAYMNMTPMEYANNYRLEKALSLLENTDMSVTEIAYEVGYSDGSYFAKSLKKKLGKTPYEYRSYFRKIKQKVDFSDAIIDDNNYNNN